MATKREVVELLKLHELQGIAEYYELSPDDARVRDDLIDAVVRSKRARLPELLAPLSRDRLKDICSGLELDTGGREKAPIIERILGDEARGDEVGGNEEDDLSENTDALLTRLLGTSFETESSMKAWPAVGSLRLGELKLGVNVFARMISGSARKNPMERRFQNPPQGHAISQTAGYQALLLGIWMEQGEDRAVLVALDAYRRIGKTTRFSMFMPVSLLEQAADTGFATHVNTRGETLYAFRPENLGRYVRVLIEEGTWKSAELDQAPAISRTKTKPNEIVDPAATADNLYIRPRVGMYAAFARLNYKPWFAIAEFVDNSIQSFLHQKEALLANGHEGPLVIDVSLDDNELSVTDRAGGIAWKDFPRAFSPAAPPDDATGLSEFGLGMKAAACWFSKRWSVRTSALGEAVERTVAFDIPRISREGVESLPIETRPSRESDHFTVVTMTDLRIRPRGKTLTKIKEHLSSIYRVLMKDEIVRIRLTTAGRTEELSYTRPSLLVAPFYKEPDWPAVEWLRTFRTQIEDRTVTGWAGILREGSHTHAGFSVFRRRRLIEGSVGETYKPHIIFGSPNSFASQRVIGELYVDGFDVTHTKDGIQWGGYEDEILTEIRSQIDTAGMPLLEQANGYRARKTAESLSKEFGTEALDGTSLGLRQPATAEALLREAESDVLYAPIPEALPPVEAVLQSRELKIQVLRDAKPWSIHLELVRDSAAPFYSTSLRQHEGAEVIGVQVNLDHEFSIAYINENEEALQPILRLIAALALGEKIARDSGVKNPGVVRKNADQILRAIVGDEPVSRERH
jgi:hypothetical protein